MAIRRSTLRGEVKRISDFIYGETRGVLNVIRNAVANLEHNNGVRGEAGRQDLEPIGLI